MAYWIKLYAYDDKNTSYDTICHEHLEYYSLKSLKFLLDKASLKIVNLSFNQINGGSIELDIAKKNQNLRSAKILLIGFWKVRN